MPSDRFRLPHLWRGLVDVENPWPIETADALGIITASVTSILRSSIS